jgi:Protein of unknown function (DUF2628)
MRYYSVHAPPDGFDSPERFLFIKDGFSWPALFVPVLWVLWHRLWLALVWYVVFVLVVAWTGRLLNDDVATVVAILGSILFALEANNIRRMALESRDWDEVGASFGKNIDEAEARFFATGPGQDNPLDRRAAMIRAAYTPEHSAQASDEPILGLFPEPER